MDKVYTVEVAGSPWGDDEYIDSIYADKDAADRRELWLRDSGEKYVTVTEHAVK